MIRPSQLLNRTELVQHCLMLVAHLCASQPVDIILELGHASLQPEDSLHNFLQPLRSGQVSVMWRPWLHIQQQRRDTRMLRSLVIDFGH